MSIGRELLEFAKDWRLDGDLMVCQHCNRGVNVAFARQIVFHANDCPLAEHDPYRPWVRLKWILEKAEL